MCISAHDKKPTRFGQYAQCEVEEKRIEYDDRRRSHLLVINDVPAGVCRQCGEKYFTAQTLKRLDRVFHNVFDRHHEHDHIMEIPTVSF